MSRSHHHHAEAKPLASSIHLQWGQQSAAGQRAHGLLPRPPQKGHSAGQPSACDTSGCQLLAVWVAAALSLAAGLEEGGTQADAPTRAAPAWVWVTVSMAPTPALSPDLAGPGIGRGAETWGARPEIHDMVPGSPPATHRRPLPVLPGVNRAQQMEVLAVTLKVSVG